MHNTLRSILIGRIGTLLSYAVTSISLIADLLDRQETSYFFYLLAWQAFFFARAFWGTIKHFYQTDEGSGVSVWSLLFFASNIVLAYAVAYRHLGLVIGQSYSRAPSATDCLYFSIVTWTTLGYGDIAPPAGGRLVAASEAVVGYVSMSLLIAVFIQARERRKPKPATPKEWQVSLVATSAIKGRLRRQRLAWDDEGDSE